MEWLALHPEEDTKSREAPARASSQGGASAEPTRSPQVLDADMSRPLPSLPSEARLAAPSTTSSTTGGRTMPGSTVRPVSASSTQRMDTKAPTPAATASVASPDTPSTNPFLRSPVQPSSQQASQATTTTTSKPSQPPVYGYTGKAWEQPLDLDLVTAYVVRLIKKLRQRGVEAPMLLSSMAVALSSSDTQRLLQAVIESLQRPSANAEKTLDQELQFAPVYSLVAVLKWMLARLGRVVAERSPPSEGTKPLVMYREFGFVPWSAYLVWRQEEEAAAYPMDSYIHLTQMLDASVGRLLDVLMDFFALVATHSSQNRMKPSQVGRYMGVLLFGLPEDASFADTYAGYVRASNATEHILLAFMRYHVSMAPSTASVPRRLIRLIGHYPHTLSPNLDASSTSVQVVPATYVARHVREYALDLVHPTAWPSTLHGLDVAPESRKLLNMAPGRTPRPRTSMHRGTESAKAATGDGRVSPVMQRWHEFAFDGFDELDTSFLDFQVRDETEATTDSTPWHQFEKQGFPQRPASSWDALMRLEQPPADAPALGSASAQPMSSGDPHMYHGVALPFEYSSEPHIAPTVMDPLFAEVWADYLVANGWSARDERVHREASFAVLQLSQEASTETHLDGSPRTQPAWYIVEEVVPADYRATLDAAGRMQRHSLPMLRKLHQFRMVRAGQAPESTVAVTYEFVTEAGEVARTEPMTGLAPVPPTWESSSAPAEEVPTTSDEAATTKEVPKTVHRTPTPAKEAPTATTDIAAGGMAAAAGAAAASATAATPVDARSEHSETLSTAPTHEPESQPPLAKERKPVAAQTTPSSAPSAAQATQAGAPRTIIRPVTTSTAPEVIAVSLPGATAVAATQEPHAMTPDVTKEAALAESTRPQSPTNGRKPARKPVPSVPKELMDEKPAEPTPAHEPVVGLWAQSPEPPQVEVMDALKPPAAERTTSPALAPTAEREARRKSTSSPLEHRRSFLGILGSHTPSTPGSSSPRHSWAPFTHRSHTPGGNDVAGASSRPTSPGPNMPPHLLGQLKKKSSEWIVKGKKSFLHMSHLGHEHEAEPTSQAAIAGRTSRSGQDTPTPRMSSAASPVPPTQPAPHPVSPQPQEPSPRPQLQRMASPTTTTKVVPPPRVASPALERSMEAPPAVIVPVSPHVSQPRPTAAAEDAAAPSAMPNTTVAPVVATAPTSAANTVPSPTPEVVAVPMTTTSQEGKVLTNTTSLPVATKATQAPKDTTAVLATSPPGEDPTTSTSVRGGPSPVVLAKAEKTGKAEAEAEVVPRTTVTPALSSPPMSDKRSQHRRSQQLDKPTPPLPSEAVMPSMTSSPRSPVSPSMANEVESPPMRVPSRSQYKRKATQIPKQSGRVMYTEVADLAPPPGQDVYHLPEPMPPKPVEKTTHTYAPVRTRAPKPETATSPKSDTSAYSQASSVLPANGATGVAPAASTPRTTAERPMSPTWPSMARSPSSPVPPLPQEAMQVKVDEPLPTVEEQAVDDLPVAKKETPVSEEDTPSKDKPSTVETVPAAVEEVPSGWETQQAEAPSTVEDVPTGLETVPDELVKPGPAASETPLTTVDENAPLAVPKQTAPTWSIHAMHSLSPSLLAPIARSPSSIAVQNVAAPFTMMPPASQAPTHAEPSKTTSPSTVSESVPPAVPASTNPFQRVLEAQTTHAARGPTSETAPLKSKKEAAEQQTTSSSRTASFKLPKPARIGSISAKSVAPAMSWTLMPQAKPQPWKSTEIPSPASTDTPMQPTVVDHDEIPNMVPNNTLLSRISEVSNEDASLKRHSLESYTSHGTHHVTADTNEVNDHVHAEHPMHLNQLGIPISRTMERRMSQDLPHVPESTTHASAAAPAPAAVDEEAATPTPQAKPFTEAEQRTSAAFLQAHEREMTSTSSQVEESDVTADTSGPMAAMVAGIAAGVGGVATTAAAVGVAAHSAGEAVLSPNVSNTDTPEAASEPRTTDPMNDATSATQPSTASLVGVEEAQPWTAKESNSAEAPSTNTAQAPSQTIRTPTSDSFSLTSTRNEVSKAPVPATESMMSVSTIPSVENASSMALAGHGDPWASPAKSAASSGLNSPVKDQQILAGFAQRSGRWAPTPATSALRSKDAAVSTASVDENGTASGYVEEHLSARMPAHETGELSTSSVGDSTVGRTQEEASFATAKIGPSPRAEKRANVLEETSTAQPEPSSTEVNATVEEDDDDWDTVPPLRPKTTSMPSSGSTIKFVERTS